MRKVDYIVVGGGLAGIAFCEVLRANHKTFVVIDDHSQQSSLVAAGLYNPVILKRFTPVWKAQEQLNLARSFYAHLETLLAAKFDYPLPVYRLFASIEEQNDWFNAADKPLLEPYLSPHVLKNTNPAIAAPFGFGEVQESGRVDTKTLLNGYQKYLENHNSYLKESFDYAELKISDHELIYKSIAAGKIIFAEGFGMTRNPYFQHLPLNVAKGEVLTIKAPDLNIDFILKSSVFLVPEGNNSYSVGATYDWEDQTNAVTEKGRTELLGKLDSFINCPYKVTNQVAGIRPTVKDRRPLIGTHPLYKNLAILNGLGTRGVMIAPYVAHQLFQFLENGKPLDSEIDIKRFEKMN